MADYYETLGVPRNASAAEVRKAYAQIAREHHPDRFSDPAEKARAQDLFKDATAAFNTLSSEKARREYDASLERPQARGPVEMAQRAFELGVQQLEAHAYHEAVEQFRGAAHLQPEVARYHAALAHALARNPQWRREAITAVERAIALEPRTASHQALLAELLLGQGLRLRALKAAEAALSLDPTDARATRVWRQAQDTDEGPQQDRGGGLLDRLRRKS